MYISPKVLLLLAEVGVAPATLKQAHKTGQWREGQGVTIAQSGRRFSSCLVGLALVWIIEQHDGELLLVTPPEVDRSAVPPLAERQ